MTEETRRELSAKAARIFPKILPPPFDEIASHRCEECDGVRHDFHGVSWWEAKSDLINANYDKLPLFTPKSHHYFFPAFLVCALENYELSDEVLDFLIYSLEPSKDAIHFYEDRKALFSAEQKDLICAFLEMIINDPQMYMIHKDVQKALSFWRT